MVYRVKNKGYDCQCKISIFNSLDKGIEIGSILALAA
jgi:hypothetical protein